MKIGIIHYRIGLTDGVSLEIEKRKKILEELGHKVITIGGRESKKADYKIKNLDYDSVMAKYWRSKFFDTKYKVRFKKNRSLKKDKKTIYQKIKSILDKEKFTVIFIHNILSLAAHPIATYALRDIILEFPNIKFILVNHDYYWEREYSRKPKSLRASRFCESLLPLTGKNIINCSINKASKLELLRFKNIDSVVIGDTFDFKSPHFGIKTKRQLIKLRESLGIDKKDVVFLQATRIVPRKAFEVSIDFIKEIKNKKEEIFKNYTNTLGFKSKNPKIYLLLSNFVEKSETDYFKKIQDYAKKQGIEMKTNNKKSLKKYTFWDYYDIADFVMYPSIQEGWGNQFLELIAAKKLGIVFEYPVFLTDIKKYRTKQITLGKTYKIDKKKNLVKLEKRDLQKAVKEFTKVVKNPKAMEKALQQNLEIIKKKQDLDSLRKHLSKIIN